MTCFSCLYKRGRNSLAETVNEYIFILPMSCGVLPAERHMCKYMYVYFSLAARPMVPARSEPGRRLRNQTILFIPPKKLCWSSYCKHSENETDFQEIASSKSKKNTRITEIRNTQINENRSYFSMPKS